MTIDLSPAAAKLLDEQMARGKFSSPSEIIEQALQLFAAQQNEAESLANFRQSITEMEAGQSRPANEAFAEIRKKHGWAD
jgi:Arc/MetJ-type ribon-helix-helix transcriptional regulator